LQSIYQIILELKPYLLLECYKKLNTQERSELYNVVADNGYELFYIDGHEEDSKTIKINSQDEMTKWKHFEILAIPDSKKGDGWRAKY
jgi:hypothetical protein